MMGANSATSGATKGDKNGWMSLVHVILFGLAWMAHRNSLPVHQHAIIDASLKAFRGSARLLMPLCSSFGDETRVLERLYYKSKNQHRSALFWRKVVELRRIALRISRLDIGKRFEGFRASFHSSTEGGKMYVDPPTMLSTIPDTRSFSCNLSYPEIRVRRGLKYPQ